MSDETKRYERSSETKQLSMPVATVAALVTALVSGGAAAGISGSSTSAAMVRVETQIEGMRDEQRRSSDTLQAVVLRLDARDAGLDERLRAVELRLERLGGQPPR